LTANQTVIDESLTIDQHVFARLEFEPTTGARFLRLTANPGLLQVGYRATVEIDHFIASPDAIAETPVAKLPLQVLTYIYPSRYCQSDRLAHVAIREFDEAARKNLRVHNRRNLRRELAACSDLFGFRRRRLG
jgi:hypothetical protein